MRVKVRERRIDKGRVRAGRGERKTDRQRERGGGEKNRDLKIIEFCVH